MENSLGAGAAAAAVAAAACARYVQDKRLAYGACSVSRLLGIHCMYLTHICVLQTREANSS